MQQNNWLSKGENSNKRQKRKRTLAEKRHQNRLDGWIFLRSLDMMYDAIRQGKSLYSLNRSKMCDVWWNVSGQPSSSFFKVSVLCMSRHILLSTINCNQLYVFCDFTVYKNLLIVSKWFTRRILFFFSAVSDMVVSDRS